ncbi:GRB2-associated-binding protein 2 [Cricetulus griseus]|nr:GRB2-associated-binding protein 2 [Cricetulus griseus]
MLVVEAPKFEHSWTTISSCPEFLIVCDLRVPVSQSPYRKPSMSSVASDEKGEYVRVDKEKTQALQKTIQEWTKMQQPSRPSKDANLCATPIDLRSKAAKSQRW